MQPIIKEYATTNALEEPDALMKAFIDKEKYKVFRMFTNTPDTKKIESYLESQLIDYYYKVSLKKANQDEVQLLHINKN